MFPTSVVRRGLESVSKATRPARNLGTSRTAKRVASRPSQVRKAQQTLFCISFGNQ